MTLQPTINPFSPGRGQLPPLLAGRAAEQEALLNASQTVSAEAPFMLVIAGTPGLQAHPNTMSATFWSRGKQIGVGLLDEASATEALTQPLAEQEPPIVIDDAALGRLGLRLEGARG